MKTLGIIPARGGSKGVPKKNIKLLNGKPLIAYTIEAALSSSLSRVIVSTDCDSIAEVSRRYGAEVFMRPSELAKDNTLTLPVLQNVVLNTNECFDAVMTLQPTSPLRTVKHIDESIKLFVDDKGADSLVSVIKVPHNFMPEKLMTISGQYISGDTGPKRRQDISLMYARNGAAIYITKFKKIEEYIFGGNILPYCMGKIESIDIDDLEDWELVEKIINSN